VQSLRWWCCGLCLFVALSAALPAGAAGPCDRLKSRAEQGLRDDLLKAHHPYDCCDETIAECLAKPRVCALAVRLRDDVCRRIERGQTRPVIERALAKRAESMLPTARKVASDSSAAPIAGDGRVSVALYLCARCPMCGQLTPLLHRTVTEGALRGRARLVARLFPTRTHKDAALANLGFQAAHSLGAFWPFALHAYANFPAFTPARQRDWARAVGLDPEAFARALEDSKVRDALVASKKEGILNHVEATPALFINGRRYSADLDLETIQDLVLEEHERLSGTTHVQR
jgi:hypothetical protein